MGPHKAFSHPDTRRRNPKLVIATPCTRKFVFERPAIAPDTCAVLQNIVVASTWHL
jgi:hypothetical protein